MWSASSGKTFHSSFLKLLSKMHTHNAKYRKCMKQSMKQSIENVSMKQSIENVTETIVDALTKVGKLN